jgi:hypothetical protein
MKDYQESLDRLVKGLYITKEEKQKRGKALQELVNKAIPMKPFTPNYLDIYVCSHCKVVNVKYGTGYCSGCGGKQDWSDND